MNTPEIQLIHLQLTKNCNLRCSFCGQWGDNGYMKARNAADLSTEDWLRVVDQAVSYRKETGVNPQFILWGGEPLASPAFPAVSEALHEAGFTTALITNGALIARHIETIHRTIETVYVSLDGPAEIHDRVRGSKGLFEKIGIGVSQLDPAKVLRVALFTICEENYRAATEFPHVAHRMGIDRVIFQNLIYCTNSQARDYRAWMKNSFGQSAPNLASWITDSFEPWTEHLPDVVGSLHTNIAAGIYPLEVEVYPGEIHAGNSLLWFDSCVPLKKDESPCLMPFRHLQINHDGNAHFCVDFNDFTLGNIRASNITELFYSEAAKRFRAEGPTCNALCARCPWYFNKSLTVDQKIHSL